MLYPPHHSLLKVFFIHRENLQDKMLKLSILAFLLISIVPTLASAITRPSHVTWAMNHNTQSDSIINLTFYLHGIYGGENATAVQVAHANKLDKLRNAFGSVVIADIPLTVTPDMNSKLIGRARGMYASASMQEPGLLMAFTFEFMDGIYSGSSFTILGKNHVARATRELPVVGGIGLFRWARGFAVVRTNSHSNNGPATIFTVGFNVTLVVPNFLKNIT